MPSFIILARWGWLKSNRSESIKSACRLFFFFFFFFSQCPYFNLLGVCVISFRGQAARSPHPLDLILSHFVPSRLFAWRMQALHTRWREHPRCSRKQHADRLKFLTQHLCVCVCVQPVMDLSDSPNCCLYCRCLVVYNWKSEGKWLVSLSFRILALSIGCVMQPWSKNDLIRELCVAIAVFCSARGKGVEERSRSGGTEETVFYQRLLTAEIVFSHDILCVLCKE